jgi:ABC-type uncharacterized transport system fused permease/ATPase subunit
MVNLDRRIDNTDQRIATSILNFTQLFTITMFGGWTQPLSIFLTVIMQHYPHSFLLPLLSTRHPTDRMHYYDDRL